ncbi:MAG: hypothetical protein ACI8UO_003141 [Verrucomicrobiales bacterium]|jgi:hypothetical protein
MIKTTKLLIAGAAIAGLAISHAQDGDGWVSLFDGKSLDGWVIKSGEATYRIEGDSIVGTTKAGSPNTFLCTEKLYGDFELEFEVKCADDLNSGCMIRSQLKDAENGKFGGRVNGPQVEIEATKDGKSAESGYIYGEAVGGGWRTKDDVRKPHKHFKDGEWNHFRIVAKGDTIETWINGQHITKLVDPAIFESHPKGFLGLQVHGVGKSGPFEVRWRKLRIKEL